MALHRLIAAILCALTVPPSAVAQPADTTGTPLVTINGTGLVSPPGWVVRRTANTIVLGAPESGSFVAFSDTKGGDADAAVAAAWAAWRPGPPPAASGARDRPVRDGWDQMRAYRYPAPAGRTLTASALRKGDRWTVVMRDMDDAVAEKRDSQIEMIFGKLLPAGFRRESFAGRPAHTIDATRLKALTGLIETGRTGLDIPGIGFGVIQHGRIVFAGGFGIRELGRPARVDADTKFMIASNTKALTTLMLAKLVERKRFDWDTPVTKLWPAFRLGDPATTARVRVRHLICACTGLPRQDFPWLFEGDVATPETVLTWLSTMRPTSGFGELYQYSNLLAGSSGYLGAHVLYPRRELGAGYDAAMQKLVFDPLGMSATTFDLAKGQAGNHAPPHGLDIDGRLRVATMGLNDAVLPSRPDGGAWSNVRDMLRYVGMELAKGRLPDGRRYIAQAPLLARQVPQVAEGSDEYYGMGLKIDRIWGVPVVHHGGTQYGYRSDMIWLPDHDVGVVILTNADSGGALRAALRRRLLEVLFDGEPLAEADLAGAIKSFAASRGEGRGTLTQPADTAASARLAVRYDSRELGRLTVRRDGPRLVFDFGGWQSEVATRRGEDGAVTFVTITPGADGHEFELAADDANGRRLATREAPYAYTFDAVER